VGGARYKGAGWLTRQATNTLAASGRLALQRYPHAYEKMPLAASSVFLSDMHPWTSVRGVRWVNCTSSKESGIYGRYWRLSAPHTHGTANRRL
jgi:hypothetical protein